MRGSHVGPSAWGGSLPVFVQKHGVPHAPYEMPRNAKALRGIVFRRLLALGARPSATAGRRAPRRAVPKHRPSREPELKADSYIYAAVTNVRLPAWRRTSDA